VIRAAEVHARIAWPAVLEQLGIDKHFLRLKKAGPCPACGGRDRYVFDDRHGRGDFYCRGCGAGDGFQLLQRVHGWSFRDALNRVAAIAGLAGPRAASTEIARPAPTHRPAQPTRRVREILDHACEPGDAADVVPYLLSRHLWPLPSTCTLRAHASLEYWQERRRLGRYSALLAEIRDLDGELVTLHVTFLAKGAKLTGVEPRKILSPLTDRLGCAARLAPITGEVLGIAEGIETALAAHQLHGVTTWAALNTPLLAKFEPPPAIRTLVIFADRDAPGLEAAARLIERLQGRVRAELRVPPAPAKDWADVLMGRAA